MRHLDRKNPLLDQMRLQKRLTVRALLPLRPDSNRGHGGWREPLPKEHWGHSHVELK